MHNTTHTRGAIVMAVYRPNPDLLRRQIDSLRAQTAREWRCVVGIDGADADAFRLLQDLVGNDARFSLLQYPDNVGVYRHFERLLRELPPVLDWVALADQDDDWYPDKFERMLPLLAAPGVSAVIGQARLVDAEGRVLGLTQRRSGSLVQVLLRNQVTGSLAIFRRAVLDAALPFPAPTDIAIHDHWLGVCAAAIGRVRVLDDLVQDYIQHEGNVLGEALPTTMRGTLCEMRGRGGFTAHLDYVARERWGWRVNMAQAVLVRAGNDLAEQRDLVTLASGRLNSRLSLIITSTVRQGHLRPKAAAGMMLASFWWPRRRRKADT